MEENKVDPSKGQFIDPMFAVIIAAAVTETIVVWVKNSTVPSCFKIAIVSLGYINLLLSWFGYHKSVFVKPILGSVRFVITVALLPVYLMTIIMFEKPFFYTAIAYAIIFFLWSVWEYFKFWEHGQKTGFFKLQFRGFNLIVYFAAIYATICSHYSAQLSPLWIFTEPDNIVAILIAIAIAYLRLQKSASTKGTSVSIIAAEMSALFLGRRS